MAKRFEGEGGKKKRRGERVRERERLIWEGGTKIIGGGGMACALDGVVRRAG